MLYAKVKVETRIGAEVLEWAYPSISGPNLGFMFLV